jgi:D-glycero-D-manno-heptose 1,7-bisphosphate phosphatase
MIEINWLGKDSEKCVIGLDRDGVINQQNGYITSPDGFLPIENSLEAVAYLRRKGFQIAIITNQSGITKGLMTDKDVDAVHAKMLDLLGKAGCPSIDAIYYSTSSHKKDYYAKPNVGMFERCEKENPSIKFKTGYYVGDKITDLKAAVKIGAKPVLVRTGKGGETEKLLQRHTYKKLKKQTFIFDDLWSFSQQF